MMTDQRFLEMLRTCPDALESKQRFTGLLKDCFPQERVMVQVLAVLYDLDLHTEIAKADRVTKDLAFRFAKQLIDERGIDGQHAKNTANLFCACYAEFLGKPCDLAVADDANDKGQSREPEKNDNPAKAGDDVVKGVDKGQGRETEKNGAAQQPGKAPSAAPGQVKWSDVIGPCVMIALVVAGIIWAVLSFVPGAWGYVMTSFAGLFVVFISASMVQDELEKAKKLKKSEWLEYAGGGSAVAFIGTVAFWATWTFLPGVWGIAAVIVLGLVALIGLGRSSGR